MTQYDDTNKGQIWKNDQKQTDSHPDFKGSLNVDGKEYWVSAWKRSPDANPKAPALRFSIQAKEVKPQINQVQPNPADFQAPDDLDQEIPF